MTDLTNKKIVMIIAHQTFRDEELFQPKEIFEAAGAQVTIASSSLDKATGKLGSKVEVQILLKDINVREFDAIIFVGGGGAVEYFDNPAAHKIVKDSLLLKKILGAICIAPVIFAKAGILKDRKATVFESEIETLTLLGVNYSNENVCKDDIIITANGPSAAYEFAKTIARALSD